MGTRDIPGARTSGAQGDGAGLFREVDRRERSEGKRQGNVQVQEALWRSWGRLVLGLWPMTVPGSADGSLGPRARTHVPRA